MAFDPYNSKYNPKEYIKGGVDTNTDNYLKVAQRAAGITGADFGSSNRNSYMRIAQAFLDPNDPDRGMYLSGKGAGHPVYDAFTKSIDEFYGGNMGQGAIDTSSGQANAVAAQQAGLPNPGLAMTPEQKKTYETQFPTVAPAAQGTTPTTPGLQFPSFDQNLKDVYAKRSDLQQLYNPDGTAKNPNDPRMQGIPTLQEWAAKYGINEEPTLKTSQANAPGMNAPTPAPPSVPGTSVPIGDIKQGFKAAVASGQEAPQSAGTAASAVKAFTPPPAAAPPTPSMVAPIEQMLNEDPGFQQLVKDRMEYNSVANQGKSLLDTYNQMLKDSGIPKLNEELINTQKIIDGTEDDIRAEIQAAGGFGTESQVLALASARNKSLIKNYNQLLATKQMAMESVNNMVNLASQDREFALQTIQQKLQIDEQLNQYRDKFVQNAKEGYNNVIKTSGYDGLFNMLQSDPSALSVVEKTLGLNPGGLQQLAASTQQQTARDFAVKNNIQQPFYEISGTVYRSNDGKAYSTPEEFFQDGGTKDFSNVQSVTGSTKPIEVSPGATLFDPTTGQPIYTAPTAKSSGSGSTGDSRTVPKAEQIKLQSRSTYSIPASITNGQYDNIANGINKVIAAAGGVNDTNRWDLWGEIAEGLKELGMNPTDFDKLLWDVFHPEHLEGYKKYNKPQNQPVANQGSSNPFRK